VLLADLIGIGFFAGAFDQHRLPDNLMRPEARGADDYIAKPFRIRERRFRCGAGE
jgi:CheY-like chemotaxis protein